MKLNILKTVETLLSLPNKKDLISRERVDKVVQQFKEETEFDLVRLRENIENLVSA